MRNIWRKFFLYDTKRFLFHKHYRLIHDYIGQTAISQAREVKNKFLISSWSHHYLKAFSSSIRSFSDSFLFTESEEEDKLHDDEYEEMFQPLWHVPGTGHHTLVLQPDIKWGPNRKDKLASKLLLEETVTLVKTLENWTVEKQITVSTKEAEKAHMFGSGNFKLIKEQICSAQLLHGVTAVIVSVARLTGLQHKRLEEEFGLPVFDRHGIVLQIFKEHAKTKESKLQIALAEIPILRSLLKGTYGEVSHKDRQFRKGTGETYLEIRHRLLTKRETKLKLALKALKSHRGLMRSARKLKEYPIISVVGYTNAGKTSLIKALSGDTGLEPVNKLFATLDVTAHKGILPNQMELIYLDTIGFIMDLPTNLIESFKASLEEIVLSDLIIHVRDISHPDYSLQKETVIQTLKLLNVPARLLETMIEVDNKFDLNPRNVDQTIHPFPISCLTGQGIPPLLNSLENYLVQTLQRRVVVFRVPTGGEESRWLYKKATVKSVVSDEDPQYSLFQVVISEAAMNKYKKLFQQD